MKKNVIALAVAAAMAAPLAAQAAPTVYGKARVSIDSIDYSSKNTTNEDHMAVSDQTSRVGIKGSEDLGGGMKAIYGFEWGVKIDGDSLSERNSYVGLAGGFGTVLAGKHDTPYKMVGSADVFGDTAADSQKDTTGIIGRNGFDTRAANAVAYVSPDLSGWTIMAAGVAGEGNTAGAKDTGLTDAVSFGVKGAIGPVKVGLGYESYSKDFAGTVKDKVGTKLDVKYTMGTLGLGVTVENSNTGTDTKMDQGVLASVTYGMGANVLAVQYGQFDQNKDHGNVDLTRTSVGVIHNFSKATNAYVAYSADDSDNDAADFSAFTVGLNTQF